MRIHINNVTHALQLVERLAALTTPEQEFEAAKDKDGNVVIDGMEYEDADEMLSDISGDRLMDEYSCFMEFVREAKEIMTGEPSADEQQAADDQEQVRSWNEG